MKPEASSRKVGQVVEALVKHWEEVRTREPDESKRIHLVNHNDFTIDYVSLSRQYGSGGRAIADELAGLMGWQVYDKTILNYMSENMQVHKDLLKTVDEKTLSWTQEWFGKYFSKNIVDPEEYHKHLTEVLMIILSHGQAIIMGRGAGFILPRERGLNVRILAPFEQRVETIAKREELSVEEAAAKISKIDKEQKAFVKNMCGKDIDGCDEYDFICSTERIGPEAVAKLIWRVLEQRHLSDQDPEKDKAASD